MFGSRRRKPRPYAKAIERKNGWTKWQVVFPGVQGVSWSSTYYAFVGPGNVIEVKTAAKNLTVTSEKVLARVLPVVKAQLEGQ